MPDRKSLMAHCKSERNNPEVIIMSMPAYFDDEINKEVETNLLSKLLKSKLDSKKKVQMLIAEVDAVVRVALMLSGVCAQSMNISEIELKESSEKEIQALSKVNDAFKQALLNNNKTWNSTTTRWTTTTPATSTYSDHVVPLINQTAKKVLATLKKDLESRGWSRREEVHEKIVNETVKNLLNRTRNYVFSALAFLPYGHDRNDLQCRHFPNDNVVDVGYRNLSFFVFYATMISNKTTKKAWENVKDAEKVRDKVLNHVFAKTNDDLCERLSTALKVNGVNTAAFGGIAAVKCGYEFVWYELGYTYFYAASSTTDYKWEMQGGAYDAKCGQIFFFL